MIQDIEGTTSEPPRRRHVAVLSAGIAAVSLALLFALVVSGSHVATFPPAAALMTRASAAPAARMTIVSNAVDGWHVGGGTEVRMTIVSNAVSGMRVDLTRTSMCADGTRLVPPYDLAFDAVTGRAFAVSPTTTTGRSFPVIFRFDARTGWMTVACAASGPVTETPTDR